MQRFQISRSGYIALSAWWLGAAPACHDVPESAPVQTLVNDAGMVLPNLGTPERLCGVGFQLENLALDSDVMLGVEDPDALGQPSPLVLSQPRAGSPHSHVWRMEKATADGSTVFLINTRPPGAYLSSRLDARVPAFSEIEPDAGTSEFSWVVQRAGAVRVGGQFDDVTYLLRPAAHPDSALEIGADESPPVRLGPIVESDAQLWKLRQFELCDL